MKKFLKRRGGGGEYQVFPSKIFCLTEPKNFLKEPFSVSLILGIEKLLLQWVMSHFSVELFSSDSAENFL